jgi:hypothetical protein
MKITKTIINDLSKAEVSLRKATSHRLDAYFLIDLQRAHRLVLGVLKTMEARQKTEIKKEWDL